MLQISNGNANRYYGATDSLHTTAGRSIFIESTAYLRKHNAIQLV